MNLFCSSFNCFSIMIFVVVVTLLDSYFPPLLKKGLQVSKHFLYPLQVEKNQSLRRRQMRMKGPAPSYGGE